jgi:hypothetical protein
MLKLYYCAVAAIIGATIGATAPKSWRGDMLTAHSPGAGILSLSAPAGARN